MVTLAEIVEFWSAEDGTYQETMDLVERMRGEGFATDVPADAARYMMSWAGAEPGEQSAYFAGKAMIALGIRQ